MSREDKSQRLILSESSYVYRRNRTVEVSGFPKSENVQTGFALRNKNGTWPIYLTPRGKYVAFPRSVKALELDRYDLWGRYCGKTTEYAKGSKYKYYLPLCVIDAIDAALGLDRASFETSRTRPLHVVRIPAPKDEAKETKMEAILKRAEAEHTDKAKDRSPFKEWSIEKAKKNWKTQRRKK